MDDAPNARSVTKDGEVNYKKVGDHLKIRYAATRPRGENSTWLEFSPANLRVWLNDQPLTTCQEIRLVIKDGFPTATLTLNLEGVDIDADTLTRLAAIVNAQKE